VIPLLWVSERARGEDVNVGRRDMLRLLRAERIAQGRQEHLVREPRGRVVHEADGIEDGPAHAAGVVAQVVLDVLFCLEVADGRRVAPAGFVAAALDAAVDGVRDVVLDVFIDEGFALLDLAVGGHAGAYGDLHGEDALNRGGVTLLAARKMAGMSSRLR